MQNMHFTPPKLARLFGVNQSTIKRWIDKGMLKASKSPGGHRRVTQQQLNAFIESFPTLKPQSYVISRHLNVSVQDISWESYYNALLKNDASTAQETLNKALANGYTLIDQLGKIIQPTLIHIGAEWEAGNVTVFEEHRMTFLIRQQLEHLRLAYASSVPQKGRHAILACTPGDSHELPLQLIDLLFAEQGWKTSVLGINISAKEMRTAIKRIQPDMICISSIYGLAPDTYLEQVAKEAQIHEAQVIIGGIGWDKTKKKVPENVLKVNGFSDLIEMIK